MGILDRLFRRGRDAQTMPAPPAAPQSPPAVPAAVLPRPGAPLVALSVLPPADRRAVLLRRVIDPTLAVLAEYGIPTDDRGRVMLLAIAGQEGNCAARAQVPVAHAKGLWQFEQGGGVKGVLAHTRTAYIASAFCFERHVVARAADVHDALERDDVLACAFARLLLWTDLKPMPATEDDGWACYMRNWRPGKPHPERWPENWRLAQAAVKGRARR